MTAADAQYRVLLTSCEGLDACPLDLFLSPQSRAVLDVLSPRPVPARRSAQWGVWYPAPSDPDAYVADLIARVRAGAYDWVVLANDATVRVVAARVHDDTLARVLLPVTHARYRPQLGSKAGLALCAEAAGLCIPRSRVYDGSRSLALLAQEVGYPLLLKADMSQCGKGVRYCAHAGGLAAAFASYREVERGQLLVQAYIAGDIISVEALYRAGALLAYTVSRILGTTSDEFSVSRVRSFYIDEALEATLRQVGQGLGIHGFATITFMRATASGEHYLIEADLRPQTWFSHGRFVGVDFAAAVGDFLAGRRVLRRPTLLPGRHEVVMWQFVREVVYCLRTRDVLGLLKWVGNVGGRWRYIPWHDPAARHLVWRYFARWFGILRPVS